LAIKKSPLLTGLSAVVLACASTVLTFDGEAVAIRGGTVVTVSGTPIQKGTVVIRGGLITAVGADVAIPADARIVDATGMTVYPGLFDSYTAVGISAPAQPAAGGQRPGGGTPATPAVATPPAAPQAAPATQSSPSGQNPELMAADQLRIAADTFESQRSSGITTALTASRDGIFQGQSALINLGSAEPAKLIIKSPVALNVQFSSGRGGGGGGGGSGYPGSLMGVFSFIRQSLLDAQHYRDSWARYEQNKRGIERPQTDKSLAALQPVLAGQLPVVLQANSAREIRRVIALAEEFKLSYLIAGGQESYEVADLLKQKNAKVLLSLNYPQRPTNIEDPESESLRTLKERADAPKAALALHKAGVKFAFQSGYMPRPQDLLLNAAKAIEAGLPKEEAIRALTLYPAQIFGVAEQLGTIEAGKIANIVVASGDIFDRRTQVKYVFIDGKQFDVKPPAAGGAAGGGGRFGGRGAPGGAAPAGAVSAAGVWTLSVNSPQGAMTITLNLRQEGNVVTGDATSPFGTAQVTDGQITGNELRFGYMVTIQGQQVPVTARGIIEGNSIRGTMSVTGQDVEFSGTRAPQR
jgi:imidazolonepropionase-like amidohydrolase